MLEKSDMIQKFEYMPFNDILMPYLISLRQLGQNIVPRSTFSPQNGQYLLSLPVIISGSFFDFLLFEDVIL